MRPINDHYPRHNTDPHHCNATQTSDRPAEAKEAEYLLSKVVTQKGVRPDLKYEFIILIVSEA